MMSKNIIFVWTICFNVTLSVILVSTYVCEGHSSFHHAPYSDSVTRKLQETQQKQEQVLKKAHASCQEYPGCSFLECVFSHTEVKPTLQNKMPNISGWGRQERNLLFDVTEFPLSFL